MITYNYRCWNCDHTFEARQSIKDEPIEECPKCGGLVRRIISGGLGALGVSHDSSRACSTGGG
ncbi:MAG: zinc ribbon domain-containing protein [Candidatus Coatesbacteria bacterium]|nr:zinc ribbon domain-containing protein [Candidatus Coatesbacteria bacterium]